MLIYTESEKLK